MTSRHNPFIRAATAYDTITRTPTQAAALLAGCLPCELAAQQAAFAVSDRPWSDFTQADYTPEQWRTACLIHLDPTGDEDPDSKSLHKLPVYEPEGALNRNGCHAAASVIGGGRGGVDAPEDKIKSAAKRLVGLYRNELDEEPPESLMKAAGMMSDDDMAGIVAAAAGTPVLPWAGPIVFENQMTGDGRMIEPNALSWDTLPIPLRWVNEDIGAHANAVVVGAIETLERRTGGAVWGTGYIDLHTDDGREAARRVGNGTQQGISVDLDSVSFEIRVAGDLLQQEEDIIEEGPAEGTEGNPIDADGRVTVIAIDADDELMVTTAARLRAATVVAIPAFEGARITLTDENWEQVLAGDTPAPALAASGHPTLFSLVAASSYPVEPPASWFADPRLPEPTRLTVTDDGRVYGHLATWGTCHRTHTQAGRCITPPSSPGGYSAFHTGTLKAADGSMLAVGRITLAAQHASLALSLAAAAAHYDNTATAVADVRAGEDAHGIWVAGALRPGVTPAQVRELRASPLSGDWRENGAGMELVAALAVNTAGYPIPAPAGLVASGRMQALVAAGTLPLDAPRDTLTPEDMELLTRLLDRERTTIAREEADRVAAEAAELATAMQAASMAYTIRTH